MKKSKKPFQITFSTADDEGIVLLINYFQNLEGEIKAKQIRQRRPVFARKTPKFARFGLLFGCFRADLLLPFFV
jgi:hypothetical protein